MTTVVEEETITDETLAPMYRIILHNDDVTPMDFVVMILMAEFERDLQTAVKIMWEAHTGGTAYVMTCGLEEAELRVDRAHSLARARKYPLTFSIEPEE